jgi:hypothetical protein
MLVELQWRLPPLALLWLLEKTVKMDPVLLESKISSWLEILIPRFSFSNSLSPQLQLRSWQELSQNDAAWSLTFYTQCF